MRMNRSEVDELIQRVRNGDDSARDLLLERLYPELRRLAQSLMAQERVDHTLGGTGSALVNQLWLRFLAPMDGDISGGLRGELLDVQDSQHLLRIAVRNMRQILVDHARGRKAQKRPQSKNKVDAEQMALLGADMSDLDADSLDVHEALKKLEQVRPETQVLRQLAERVKFLRRARGWSQEQLADRAAMQRSYLADLERGHRNPSVRTLVKLANAFEIGIASLFQEDLKKRHSSD